VLKSSQSKFTSAGLPTVRAARAAASLAIVLTLSACAPQPAPIDLPPVGGATAPGADGPAPAPAVGMLSTGASRTMLPNETALPGENFIRSVPGGGFLGGSLDQILRSAGPLPSPFEFTISRDFVPMNGGAMSYAVRTPSPGVTCVLAAGRNSRGSGARILMRNCVNGDVGEALAPVAY
jgi:hypothetical protein